MKGLSVRPLGKCPLPQVNRPHRGIVSSDGDNDIGQRCNFGSIWQALLPNSLASSSATLVVSYTAV